MESLPIAKRTVLAECDQSIVSLLRSIRVARLERLSELLETGLPLLAKILRLLIDGFGAASVSRVRGVLNGNQTYEKSRRLVAAAVLISSGL
jgi:hypothetical protein